jgi:predicted Zn-dependent protease
MARLGQCRFLQGLEKEARRLLEAAVVDLPEDPAVLLYLAKMDLQDEEPSRAEQRLLGLLRVDPFDTEGRYTLYLCLEKLGRQEEAASTLKKWQEDKAQLERANNLLREEASHPSNNASTAFTIGDALIHVAQENLGLYWLNKALERDGTFQPAIKALVEHYEKKGAVEKADQYRRLLADAGKK